MKYSLLFLLLWVLSSASLQGADYNILNFGATPGMLSTEAVQKAVDECHTAGGGRVIVPPGTFITGCIVLKSNVNLHLEPGSELLGSENMEDYRVQNVRRGIIHCEDAINVSISGSGITILNNILLPNSDGIHTTVSRNIRISNCNILAGDDAIVVTGFPKDEEIPTFNSADQDAHQYGNKTIYAENVTVTNCVLKSSSAGIRIGYGQHPIRRCTFSNIVIYDSHRGIGIFAHDASNIEDLIFTDVIIETRLRNGQWWGHGEPIHISSISRFEGRVAGQIKNVLFTNINAIGEQGILLFGQKESPMENIRFNNVQLRMRKGKETTTYGGNFDLRPATPKAMQIFEHDIPGIYAQHVNKLSIRDFYLSWDIELPSFFTHGIQCKNVTDLLIKGFIGSGNPNAPGSEKIKLENTVVRDE